MIHGDSRNLKMIPDESVGLVVTSPPYWNKARFAARHTFIPARRRLRSASALRWVARITFSGGIGRMGTIWRKGAIFGRSWPNFTASQRAALEGAVVPCIW